MKSWLVILSEIIPAESISNTGSFTKFINLNVSLKYFAYVTIRAQSHKTIYGPLGLLISLLV